MHARIHTYYSTYMHTYTHAYTHVDIGMDITHNTLRVAHQLLYTLGLTRACVREQLRAGGKPHGPRVFVRSRPCAAALRGAIPARLAASLLRPLGGPGLGPRALHGLAPLRRALLVLVVGSWDVDEAGVVVLGAAAAGVKAAHVWPHRGVLAKGCTPADSVRKRFGQWGINVLA